MYNISSCEYPKHEFNIKINIVENTQFFLTKIRQNEGESFPVPVKCNVQCLVVGIPYTFNISNKNHHG